MRKQKGKHVWKQREKTSVLLPLLNDYKIKRVAYDRGEKLHKEAIILVYTCSTANDKKAAYELWLRLLCSQIQIDIVNIGNTNYQVAFLTTKKKTNKNVQHVVLFFLLTLRIFFPFSINFLRISLVVMLQNKLEN